MAWHGMVYGIEIAPNYAHNTHTHTHLIQHYMWPLPLYPLVMLSVSFNFLVDLLRQSLSVFSLT